VSLRIVADAVILAERLDLALAVWRGKASSMVTGSPSSRFM
jgi:hypothetical protein